MKHKLLFIGARKAHLNGTCDEEVYVALPIEAAAPGKCGRLRKWLYGCRGAAQGWEEDYTTRLEEIGFKAGAYAPTVFHRQEWDVRAVVHGDDFTFLGPAGPWNESRSL